MGQYLYRVDLARAGLTPMMLQVSLIVRGLEPVRIEKKKRQGASNGGR